MTEVYPPVGFMMCPSCGVDAKPRTESACGICLYFCSSCGEKVAEGIEEGPRQAWPPHLHVAFSEVGGGKRAGCKGLDFYDGIQEADDLDQDKFDEAYKELG